MSEPTPTLETPRQIAVQCAQHLVRHYCHDSVVETISIPIENHIRIAIATERAAREQDRTEHDLVIQRLHDSYRPTEARLAEALDHIRWLQPMAKGWSHAHESIASNHRIVLAADEFLAQTTPAPILAEVERLRGELEWARKIIASAETSGEKRNDDERALACYGQDQRLRAESAESALAALKARKEIHHKCPECGGEFWMDEASVLEGKLAALKAENTTLLNAQKAWSEKTHACLAAATGSAVSVHYREGGKFDSLTASTVRKLAATCAALKAELEQTQKQFGTCSVCGFVAWKNRDAKTEECQYCALKLKLNNSIDQNDLLAALTRRGFEVSGLDGDESPEDIVANWMASEIRDAQSECGALKPNLELATTALEKIATAILRDRDELKGIAREALSQLNESEEKK